jgi:hypothetical protein
MIVNLFSGNPMILCQTSDNDEDIPSDAIGASVDGVGGIVLEQRDHRICIDRGSVPDLIKMLRALAKGEE